MILSFFIGFFADSDLFKTASWKYVGFLGLLFVTSVALLTLLTKISQS